MSVRQALPPALAIGALSVQGVHAGSPLRAFVVLLFLIVAPGFAVVRLVRLPDPLAELTLAVALSIGLDSLVALAYLYAGVAWIAWTLATLVALTIVLSALDLVALARSPR